MHDFGRLAYIENRQNQAEKYFLKCLTTRHHLFGETEQSKDASLTLHSLGHVYKEQGLLEFEHRSTFV